MVLVTESKDHKTQDIMQRRETKLFYPTAVRSRRLISVLLLAIIADYCLNDLEDINDPDAEMHPGVHSRIGRQSLNNLFICSRVGVRLLMRAEDELVDYRDDVVDQVGPERCRQIEITLGFLGAIYHNLFDLLLWYERHLPGAFNRARDAV